MKKTKNLLFKKFTVYSLIAFIITGVVLNNLIIKHIKNDLTGLLPVGEINVHLNSINSLIFIVMFIGLLILYLFLMKIIYSASKTLVNQNSSLQEQKSELEKSNDILKKTYKDTIKTLSSTVDARDSYTAGHSERVATLSVKIAEKLGLEIKEIEILETSALFHDIGKMGVPDSILLKPDKLNEMEFDKIKEHPTIGINILNNIEFIKESLPAIKHHHEREDGSGYPDGLKGKEIPLGSKIIGIADSYDAMKSDRPYRKGLSHEAAILEIIRCKSTQFDSELVDIFLTID